ncbi:Gfo/Idh/MocA family oxidoreductase, partial [bacterium]|nr:Gfo/Idh/MocA family oxidoreductase [bacterium]
MTYKVAFIGASGHWGYVTEGMQQLPNTEFTAYAPSFVGEDVSAFASMTINGRKAEAFSDYVKMLDTMKPDIVSITPRYDLIAPIAIECVKRGIHVVLEKPVALNLEDLAALETAVKTAGVQLYPMFGIRYEPAFYTAKKLMEQGAIGEPALIW